MEQFFSSETIALITLALLIVGFSKFIVYYKSFGVPIVDYIDPSEIITLFADNIATASVITLVLAVPYFGLVLPYNLSGLDKGLNFIDRLSKHLDLLLPMMLGGLAFIIAVLIFLWKRPRINRFELSRYVWALLIISVLLPLVSVEIGAHVVTSNSQQLAVDVALILSFSFMILLATWNEIEKVKRGYFSNVEVQFDDLIIKSTATNYYIGKTKSYLFFYSADNCAPIAYSTNKLKSINYIPQQ
jgi:hypothetical protein